MHFYLDGKDPPFKVDGVEYFILKGNRCEGDARIQFRFLKLGRTFHQPEMALVFAAACLMYGDDNWRKRDIFRTAVDPLSGSNFEGAMAKTHPSDSVVFGPIAPFPIGKGGVLGRVTDKFAFEISMDRWNWDQVPLSLALVLADFKSRVEINNYGPNGKIKQASGFEKWLNAIYEAIEYGFQGISDRTRDEAQAAKQRREQNNKPKENPDDEA